MSFQQQISKAAGIPASEIPASYQIVGHVMLLRLLKAKDDETKKKLAEAVLSLYPGVRTVCELQGSKGELRQPSITVIAGNGTEVLHKENGIIYHFDAAQVMFSKGNLFERQRLIEKIKSPETVVDMFAGIGYFSLGLAKFSRAGKIIAIEKNPVAFRYLRNNLKINKVNFETIFGDCLNFDVENFADRVIMGYFPGTEKFLPQAVNIAKNGAVVHYHNCYFEKDLWKKPLGEIKKSCKKAKILGKRKVKSIAPRTCHAVVDFQVLK
ncbi:MAG: methyltransferase [Candidatus Aenigmarchaeota archaeon]|nr:methyltransferase [Candidatus Aenigmarchaeota archaeon]